MYVLLSDKECYFVEYLMGQLILSQSISEAMKFDNEEIALKFKQFLFEQFNIKCSVNTFIS